MDVTDDGARSHQFDFNGLDNLRARILRLREARGISESCQNAWSLCVARLNMNVQVIRPTPSDHWSAMIPSHRCPWSRSVWLPKTQDYIFADRNL